MNNPSTGMNALFGQAGKTAVWGVDLSSAKTGEGAGMRATKFELPIDNLVAIYQMKGEAHFDFGKGLGERQGGQGLVITKTGSQGGVLIASEDFSGIVIGFSTATIRSVLDSHRPGLDVGIREVVFSTTQTEPIKRAIPSYFVDRWLPDMRNAPVSGPAVEFWYEGKIREFISLACFHDKQPREEFFCSRQKVVAMDRVTMVKNYLNDHVDDRLDLEALAQHVGCSRHYLSRTFSEFTGATISQHLRCLRIERAAELLVSGKFNVSEVALEVGYQSLSHFSKAFFQEKGCLPSKYDHRVA